MSVNHLVGPIADPDARVEAIARRVADILPKAAAGPRHRLPSERALAALLHCSRNTIREALARLRERGVIEVRARSGAYEPPRRGADTRQQQALAALQLVGPELARRAADRCSAECIERLEEHTSQISRALIDRDPVAASRAFISFYCELGRIADNPYLHHVLARVEADGTAAPRGRTAPRQRLLEAFFTQHVDVFQALRRSDAQHAQKLAERCIRAFVNLIRVTDAADDEAPP